MGKKELKEKLIDIIESGLYWDEFSGMDTLSLDRVADEIIELFENVNNIKNK